MIWGDLIWFDLVWFDLIWLRESSFYKSKLVSFWKCLWLLTSDWRGWCIERPAELISDWSWRMSNRILNAVCILNHSNKTVYFQHEYFVASGTINLSVKATRVCSCICRLSHSVGWFQVGNYTSWKQQWASQANQEHLRIHGRSAFLMYCI